MSDIHEVNSVSVRPMKVGLLGPSGIGKTSVVVSLLHEARKIFEGLKVTVEPINDTRAQVDTALRKLRSHIRNRRFDPGRGLAGDRNTSLFELKLSIPSFNSQGIKIEFLDYPGGWLQNPSLAEANWNTIEEFICESEILLIPVDAALIMEACTVSQNNIVAERLCVEAVERVVEKWATARQEKGLPCALTLVPLKCESYLNDNGGYEDRVMELETKVLEWYAPVINRFQQNHLNPELLYCPVDTMGCVEVQRIRWDVPECRFSIRGKNPDLAPKGAGDIFVTIVHRYLKYFELLQLEAHQQTTSEAQRAQDLVNLPRPFILDVIFWITGELRKQNEVAEGLSAKVAEEAEALNELAQTLHEIRYSKPSGRLKEVSLKSRDTQ